MIFESFSVILRQISLGVPTVRHRLFSLSYEKILQKSRFLGLCRNARSNFTRSTFVRRRLFSLSYEKILQKSRLWVFSEILRQISLGVHSYAVVHFPCLTKNPSKIELLGLFGDTASNFTRSTFACCRSFSDRATKCVTRFTFNTNFNLCHSSGWRANLYKTRIV